MLERKITILLFLVASFAFGQKLDCQKFKTGKFKIIDPKEGTIVSVRTDSSLTFYNTKARLRTKYDLEWINECTFTLKNFKIIENPNNLHPLQKGIVYTCEIVEIKKNSFFERCTESIFNLVRQEEVFLIE